MELNISTVSPLFQATKHARKGAVILLKCRRAIIADGIRSSAARGASARQFAVHCGGKNMLGDGLSILASF
ncbi:hypothetical protein MHYP_G00021390 [Metynnis hypsauchen]